MFRSTVHTSSRNILHKEICFKNWKSLVNIRKYAHDTQNAETINNVEISKDMVRRIEKRKRPAWSLLSSTPNKEKSKTNTSFVFFDRHAPTIFSFSVSNIKQWWKHVQNESIRDDQSFVLERHQVLGYDLAAAHFILCRGGKVMFKGFSEWINQNDENYRNIPSVYDPNFIVIGIDVCGFHLCYEGLDNLYGLTHLEWLSLKGSLLDDWGLDKISAEYPNLKYLDVSDCKDLSERGLESLYRMFNLEKLIVTNHHKSAAFELTCLMLEECNPKLTCEIHVPEEEKK